MAASAPDHEIVVVGAGFSGIGAAIKLRRAGFCDYVVLDEADGVGGTWHWNTYPGIAVDIPSFSYQYSFEPRTSWSRVYAPGAELKDYAEHCVDKYGVRDAFRFGTGVAEANYDESEQCWRLTTTAGEELSCRFLLNATGALTAPKKPDIAGIDEFSGEIVHTARWDDSVDLAGKRVGIIGTGASAVQLIPEIAPAVESLVVFQRTPIWCFPKLDGDLPRWLRTAMRVVPGGARLTRLASQTFVELNFPLAAHYNGVVPIAERAERLARRFIEHQVKDPELRRKLTPGYPVGCKRPSFHNSYLSTFNRPNVTLETAMIEKAEPRGVCVAGQLHDLDVLILATGFRIFEPGAMPPFTVRGRGGVSIDDWWRENRLQAYEGISVPGFPNLFTIFGPYGYNGSSYFNLIETQLHHIVRVLKRARTDQAAEVEVRREANDRYFESMLARRGNQIFWQDNCNLANSYYFDPVHGDVPLRPAPTLETVWRAHRFDLDDYRFSRAPAASAVGA